MVAITRLPKPDPNIHLSKDGYKVSASKVSRHKALKKGSKKYGTLATMRRVNLIRNLTKRGTKNRDILGEDVEYMKKLYRQEKSKKSTNNKKSKKTTKTGKKRC